MNRFATLLAGGAVVLSAAAACSRFDAAATTPPPDGGAVAPEAGPETATDSGVEPSPNDASADVSDAAPVNLVPPAESDFEADGVGAACGPRNFDAIGKVDPIAHTGAHGCKLCRQNVSSGYTFNTNDIGSRPQIGEHYVGSAWVRADVDGGVTQNVNLVFRSKTNGTVGQQPTSATVLLTTEWVELRVELEITVDAERLDLYVESDPTEASLPNCMVVDDVVAVRVQ